MGYPFSIPWQPFVFGLPSRWSSTLATRRTWPGGQHCAVREPAQLERLGFTLLDVVPDRAPGPRNGVLFMKRFGGELPFSPELGPGQPVFVTVGHAEEVNDKIPSVTFRGEVIGVPPPPGCST